MAFAGFCQNTGAFFGDEFGGDLFDSGGTAFGNGFDSKLFFHFAKGVEKAGAGEYGGPRNGGVGLGFGPLVHFYFFSVFHERAFNTVSGPEFVGEGARAVGHFFEEVFDGACMAPGQNAVDVFHAGIHAVVGFGSEGDDGEFAGELFADIGGDLQGDAVAGDFFTVFGSEFLEDFDRLGVGVDRGDDERAKEIAFAAFVDAHVGLDAFGIVNGFIAQKGFARDFWLKDKSDPLFSAFSLYKAFPGVVKVDATIQGSHRDLGVRHFRGGVFGILKDFDQFDLLRVGEFDGMGVLFHGEVFLVENRFGESKSLSGGVYLCSLRFE